MKIFNKVSLVFIALVFVFGLGKPIAVHAAGPLEVNLGAASNFTILAKSGISTTGSTVVVGDIGVSPAAATYITGFGLVLPVASTFATSSQVDGKVYAPGYANPTPANLSAAVSAMETAYTDAAGRTNPTATELYGGNLGGRTLAPGLYKWSTGVTIPTDVTLSGSSNDVWIFQIAKNLDISSAKKVILSGGAKASNIFWVVAGKTTLGTTAVFNGNILGQTAIVLNNGAKLNGRALAQTAVTLDANYVTTPSPSSMISPISTTTSTTITTSTSSSNSPSYSSDGGSSVTSSSPSYFGQQVRAIAVTLRVGSRGDSVRILQEFLISQNKGSKAFALKNDGADGIFGQITRAAVVEWQASNSLVADGLFGPKSRAKAY